MSAKSDDNEVGDSFEYFESENDLYSKEIEFERNFYSYLVNDTNFEVIPIPDENGKFLSKEEKKLITKEAARLGIKLIYRVSHGKIATVFSPYTLKVGVMPDTDSKGFTC